MRRQTTLFAAALLMVAGLGVPASDAAPADLAAKPRVLVWGGTYGFRHPSITDAEKAFLDLATESGAFTATVTENPLDLSMATLQNYDALAWVSTTGKPPTLTQTQRDEVIRWSQCGGGNLGFHAALDADYGWAEHAELFGAQFDSHPQGAGAGQARMIVEDPKNPIVTGWKDAPSFMLDDEYYRWRTAKGVPGISLPRNDKTTRVLLSLDETTVAEGIQAGPLAYEHRQPIAWTRTFRGGGRVFYNNMGHSSETWALAPYRTSIVNALKWVSGVRPNASCLAGTSDVSTRLTPPAPKALQVGKPCPVPVLKPRTGGTWETSGAARRLRETGDLQAFAAGIAGNLAWGAQTWVLDLSQSKARTADVTVDLTWPSPTDDYDLSVTTGWGIYGSHNGIGTSHEQLVLKNVPTCAILHVAGDNLYALSQAGPTATLKVTPHAVAAPAPVRPPANATGATTRSISAGNLAATGGVPALAALALGLLVLALGLRRLHRG